MPKHDFRNSVRTQKINQMTRTALKYIHPIRGFPSKNIYKLFYL